VFTTVTLRDRRVLEYVDLGDPTGTPVMFCHGTPGTAGQAAIAADSARRHGVRVVAASRPGYGATTLTPPGLAAAAADLLELAEGLRLDRFATMGLSGGGPFALAVAALAPDRVTAVAVHAGTAAYFDVMPPSEADAAERRATAMFVAGDHDGAVAEMSRSADADFGELRGLSATDFETAMLSTVPPGENWLERHPDARRIFLADFRRAIAGSAGYARDNLSWGAPWDVDLSAVTSPVRLVCGDADAMVPRPHAEWLRERLPTAELHLVPGGHGDATFGAVEEAFRAMAAAGRR
jgi:pimeloyl-ACP methyl ester carboxylesterase